MSGVVGATLAGALGCAWLRAPLACLRDFPIRAFESDATAHPGDGVHYEADPSHTLATAGGEKSDPAPGGSIGALQLGWNT